MFDIDYDDDAPMKSGYKSILDCLSAASSFVAEDTNKYGVQVVGCDPLFDDVNTLARKGEDIEYVVKKGQYLLLVKSHLH
jgi:hypothetical protein